MANWTLPGLTLCAKLGKFFQWQVSITHFKQTSEAFEYQHDVCVCVCLPIGHLIWGDHTHTVTFQHHLSAHTDFFTSFTASGHPAMKLAPSGAAPNKHRAVVVRHSNAPRGRLFSTLVSSEASAGTNTSIIPLYERPGRKEPGAHG